MPIAFGLLILLLAAAPAAALDLPILRPGAPVPSGPAYRSDALTLELHPAPARRAAATLAGAGAWRAGVPLDRLGLPGPDAVAASLGGARFAPMFAAAARLGGDATLAGFYRVTLPPGADLEEALRRFGSLADVAVAEPIPVVPVASFPNDSLFSVSTWFYQPSRHDVHAPEAWALGLGDTSVVVGILDTGVVPYHPDLGGTIAGLSGQLFVNWAERAGAPGVDDDGNGYVDDVSGWDFVSDVFDALPNEDARDEDNDPNDFAGHGTMVAGLVGAIADNTIGVTGTAPGVRLMPLRVGWSASGLSLGEVDMSYAAEAIVYGTMMGASVLNCSFATLSTAPLQAAVTMAAHAGVVIVFAAGNNNQVHDLALRSDVVAVAAVDANDQVASFSNTGSYVDVAAPGVNITSTFLVHSSSDSIGERKPAYGTLSGTSFATPIVSGGLALYESRRRALGARRLSPLNLALRLWDTADDISALNVGVSGYGGGRLDLEKLLLDPPVSHAHPSGSRSLVPNVVIHERRGARIYWVAANRALVGSDGVTGDTLVRATLPGTPALQLAAGDLGGGRGVGLFVGTLSGKMCGYTLGATPLPGWPYSAPSAFTQFSAGPALGDLDGDGALEVASGSGDGQVWAWKSDGSLMAGFPVATSGLGIAGAIALADVDGQPGDEILVAARDGSVHAIRFDGSEAPGWPVTLATPAPSQSPVVARFGASPAILVACGDQLRALRGDGSLRWSVALGGTAGQDPALADLDADGADEIVVPLASPNALAAFDSTGAPLTARGWPAALGAAPAGPPVIGPIAAGVPQGALIFVGSSLAALNDSARALPSFPKSGGAGLAPTLDELDGDGRTEVAAGTGPDSLFYVYDAGASSWTAGAPWPTPRGDFARRGSRVAPLALPVVDLTPPGPIADLRVDSLGVTVARMSWSAPGGDGAVGRAASYEVNATSVASDAGRFLAGSVRHDALTPDSAGTLQTYRLTGLTAGASLWVAVRAVDSTGNVGASSNVVHVGVSLGPIRVSRPVDLAPLRQPSPRPVTWQWRLEGSPPGAREIRIFDVSGRRVCTLPVPSGTAGELIWDGRDVAGRFVPAGLYFARLVSGSIHAQSRVVLLP